MGTFDYDDDGWPDIYVACDSAPSILYHNNHDGTFTDEAVTMGVAFSEEGREQAGMGATVADYNGDGRPDLFKTNFSDDTPTLYRNDGNGNFSDVTVEAGLGKHMQYLGWGTMFFDFDNDGWPDLILANGHVYPEVDKFHWASTTGSRASYTTTTETEPSATSRRRREPESPCHCLHEVWRSRTFGTTGNFRC